MGTEVSDVLSMSDDDFLKMNSPADVVETPPAEVVPEVQPQDPVVETDQEPEVPPTTEPEQAPVTKTDEELAPTEDNPLAAADKDLGTKPQEPVAAKEPEPVVKPEAAPAEKPAVATVTSADKEAFYDKVMTGFKANGKQIELRSPEELIQLAQMGCNYTAKMQQIAPHRKVLMMLENNGLLDEGKLSYLIDLDKKDPEAIKKLIAEAGINPMDIDTEVAPQYREGNHRVDDKEVTFRSTLDEMKSDPEGLATLQVLNSTWDQASKDALFENPDIMTIMHQQRKLGVYDRIAAEVARQVVLGTIPSTKPFVEAYQVVGKQMAAAGQFNDLEPAQPHQAAPTPAPATPVATRVAAPKPAVAHNDKANAAAPSRTTPRQAKVLVNPLEMSDDEFLKQMNGRL